MRSFTIATLLIMIISCSEMNAQYVKYSREIIGQLGGSSTDIVNDIISDKYNKTYVIGSFIANIYSGDHLLKSAGSDDIFLAVYYQDGTLSSFERFGGRRSDQGGSLTLLNDGSLVFCGNIMDTVRFGNVTSNGIGGRMFIAKRNGIGNYEWATTLSSDDGASLPFVGSDNGDNIYIAGNFRGTLTYNDYSATSYGGNDVFIAKMNKEGSITDIKHIGSAGNDNITAFSVSPSGKVFISGLPGGNFNIDQLNITADLSTYSSCDPYLVCLDGDLNAVSQMKIDGEEFCEVRGISFDTDDNVFVSGSHNMHVTIADSSFYSQGYSDGFLIKYNPDFSFKWARSLGSWYYDYANAVTTDLNGLAIVSGTLGDIIEIDDIQLAPADLNNNSAYLLVFSPEGEAVWGKCISGAGVNGMIGGRNACINQSGDITLAGEFSAVNIETETDILTSKGDQDIFIASYYPNCINLRDEIKGDPFLCPESVSELSVTDSYNNIAWNNGVTQQNSITINAIGLYSVTLTDPYGCDQSDTIIIKIPDFYLGNDTVIPANKSLQLMAPEGFQNFEWNDGSSEVSYSASATNNIPGSYDFWLNAEYSQGGCIARDTITIRFSEFTGINSFPESSLKIFPVPANEYLYVIVDAEQADTDLKINLISLEGKIVLSGHTVFHSGIAYPLEIQDVKSGLYILQIQMGNESINQICLIRH